MSNLLDIIICSFNRKKYLAASIEAVLPQLAGKPDVKLVVVDNNSSDGTAEMLAEYGKRHPECFVWYSEKRQGLSYARNRGIIESKAKWLAFLDDDGLAHSDWLEMALAVIGADDFDFLGGVCLPLYAHGAKPDWLGESFGSNLGKQAKYGLLPEGASPDGFNMLCKHQHIVAAGNFPVDLGMHGDTVAYGEETFVCEIMRKNGSRIGFVPNLRIDHHVTPAKCKMGWHFKAEYVKGRDYWKIHNKKSSKIKGLTLALTLPFMAVRDFARGVFKLHKSGRLNWSSVQFYFGCRVARRCGRICGSFK